jgi:hypothetical protein
MRAESREEADMLIGSVLRESSLPSLGGRNGPGELEKLEVVNEPGGVREEEDEGSPEQGGVPGAPLRGLGQQSAELGDGFRLGFFLRRSLGRFLGGGGVAATAARSHGDGSFGVVVVVVFVVALRFPANPRNL